MRSRQMLWQALNCFKNAKKPLKKFWFFSLPVNICNAELLPRSWPRHSYSLVIKCLRHYSLHQANEAKVSELSRQPPYSHELSGIIQWKSYPLLVTIATQASFPLLLSKVCLHNHLGEISCVLVVNTRAEIVASSPKSVGMEGSGSFFARSHWALVGG